jgi:DNA-directed RNA polymerase specialized sigma24 family protein
VLGGTAGDGWGRAAAYDAYADGLHTYSLWYLRDHDAAADAVYCAFVAADRNHTNLQQPEQIQPWLYALLRRECRLRAKEGLAAPEPVSRRLRPKSDALGESDVTTSLIQLEGNLRRAEFQSLAWPEAEGLAPAHREVLELTIRHGLDSRGLALVLGLREAAGIAPTHGFGLLADAWRELERSLAAAAVAGSGRDNCAQLAELTFGWSGKLTGTLRAPLIEHVDRCSRCQHYLHTVIGTPSAPTRLPFVAAPRALREILLAELADADAASDARVDLVELGNRCGKFGPEGFPGRLEQSTQQGAALAAGAGRGPKRRQPGPGGRTVGRPPSAKTNLQPRTPDSDGDLYRAKGSWADKVLPPAPGTEVSAPPGPWRPPPSQGFIQTPTGRFSTGHGQGPGPAPRVSSAPLTRAPAPGAPRLPQFANSSMATRSPSAPASPGIAKPVPRPRHKARPMRQAVVSAMALGAIGAVAAAAASMLGGSNPHSNTTALDGSQGSENVGTSSTPSTSNTSRMTISVTTVSKGSTGLLTGPASVVGLPTSPSSSSSAASPTPTSASSGAFYVSVNQRAADPNSVQILLRNTGGGPLHWSAAPSVSWLTLSQSSGTLAAGQSLNVTATATSSAPSGQWAAQIVFSPGGIVVTLHGGVPVSTGGGGGGGTPTASPTTAPPTTTSPTPTATGTGTGSQPTATATATGTSSGSQGPTPTSGTTAGTGTPSTPSGPPPVHQH